MFCIYQKLLVVFRWWLVNRYKMAFKNHRYVGSTGMFGPLQRLEQKQSAKFVLIVSSAFAKWGVLLVLLVVNELTQEYHIPDVRRRTDIQIKSLKVALSAPWHCRILDRKRRLASRTRGKCIVHLHRLLATMPPERLAASKQTLQETKRQHYTSMSLIYIYLYIYIHNM